jgi:hypothetical protein
MSDTLPDCMMPDGAEPCKGYRELRAENGRLHNGFHSCALIIGGLEAENERLQLTIEELNLLRQWYNALVDVMPSYLSDADHELARKIVARLENLK